tara:strand:- start:84 stop:332 length:249 start_codon:yes stop_codon:yes gene_type:complete
MPAGITAKAIGIYFWPDVVSHFYELASKKRVFHCRFIEQSGVTIVAPDGCDDEGTGFNWRFYPGGIIRPIFNSMLSWVIKLK